MKTLEKELQECNKVIEDYNQGERFKEIQKFMYEYRVGENAVIQPPHWTIRDKYLTAIDKKQKIEELILKNLKVD